MAMLDGKVALVTGAGRGLGRVEALELAKNGARVVVADLGVGRDGTGRDESAANAVIEEIKAAGGEATAYFGDVTSWDDAKGMVGAAIDTYGSLDILVNNAGFCRDKTIFGMSEDEFDSVVAVHLKGHFCTMRFACEYWRNKGKETGGPVGGRMISTSSEAFIFGSPGQPNYAAAKAGIVAMTMGAAQLMSKYGVTANVIMPRARTAMTDTGPVAALFEKPEEGFDVFAPEHVGPLVAYLASDEAANVSGYVMIVYGDEIKMVQQPALGPVFKADGSWDVDDVAAKLGPYFDERTPIVDGFAVPPQ